MVVNWGDVLQYRQAGRMLYDPRYRLWPHPKVKAADVKRISDTAAAKAINKALLRHTTQPFTAPAVKVPASADRQQTALSLPAIYQWPLRLPAFANEILLRLKHPATPQTANLHQAAG